MHGGEENFKHMLCSVQCEFAAPRASYNKSCEAEGSVACLANLIVDLLRHLVPLFAWGGRSTPTRHARLDGRLVDGLHQEVDRAKFILFQV